MAISKRQFLKKTALGGLVIMLPMTILVMGFKWLAQVVTDMIQPFTDLVVRSWGFPELLGDFIVLSAMFVVCFVVGWLVSTAGGAWFHHKFDDRLQRMAPGYRLIKDIVNQFFGDENSSPFANGEVALVTIFGVGHPTQVTAIITSKHQDGRYTVFVPTGPNPTSGNIYHVDAAQVELRPNADLERCMRTIIACGAGSGALFKS